jgi:hypothetical protein
VRILNLWYGGQRITDRAVLERFHDATRDNGKIEINNTTLGCDPRQGERKKLTVEYTNTRDAPEWFVKNYDLCVKRRSMNEGETIDFNWDIVHAMWGSYPDYTPGDRLVTILEPLFWALDHDEEIQLTVDNLHDDPALGRKKDLRIDVGQAGGYNQRYDVDEWQNLRFACRWGEKPQEGACLVM